MKPCFLALLKLSTGFILPISRTLIYSHLSPKNYLFWFRVTVRVETQPQRFGAFALPEHQDRPRMLANQSLLKFRNTFVLYSEYKPEGFSFSEGSFFLSSGVPLWRTTDALKDVLMYPPPADRRCAPFQTPGKKSLQ
jgi:hypothetical protein